MEECLRCIVTDRTTGDTKEYRYKRASAQSGITTINELDVIRAGRGIHSRKYQTPNDILLYNDVAISRDQFEVNVSRGFSQNPIPRSWVQVLYAAEKGHMFASLPTELLHYIFSFLREPKGFVIRDLGSRLGTLIRLPFEGLELASAQRYALGHEARLQVKSVYCKVRGEAVPPNTVLKAPKIGNFNMDDYPWIEVEIKNNGEVSTYKVFASESKHVFSIGRREDCDIRILNPTVSRCQATIHCTEQGQWFIKDGNGESPSTTPTVRRLCREVDTHRFLRRCDIDISNTSITLQLWAGPLS